MGDGNNNKLIEIGLGDDRHDDGYETVYILN